MLTLATAVGMMATAVLAGCGSTGATLGTASIETAITKSILVQRGAHSEVTCPAVVAELTGEVFTCHAALKVGDYPVTVTEINARGGVRWDSRAALVLLNERHVAAAIRRSVFAQRGARATVSCPSEVLQQKGLSFICRAHISTTGGKVKPGTYRFRVTEGDASGHVSYVGV